MTTDINQSVNQFNWFSVSILIAVLGNVHVKFIKKENKIRQKYCMEGKRLTNDKPV